MQTYWEYTNSFFRVKVQTHVTIIPKKLGCKLLIETLTNTPFAKMFCTQNTTYNSIHYIKCGTIKGINVSQTQTIYYTKYSYVIKLLFLTEI